MSLLEQMKLQAQKALEVKENTAKLSAEALAERNAKLREIFDYWRQFAELTKVIEPEIPYPLAIPRVGEMTEIKLTEPFADYRYVVRSNQNFSDEIGHATLFFYYKSPNSFKFKREVGLASRVEDELWRYGIAHTTENLKNDQHRTVEIAFNVPCEVKASVHVSPIENSKILRFILKNVAKLGEMEVEMPFERVNTEFLDELSHLILGQENCFWKLVKL